MPRRTCSAPPKRSGGVHAVAVPTPLPATHLTSSVQALPPLPVPHLPIPHVHPPGPASHRRCSGPSCSWWTWQGASVSVRGPQHFRMFLEFVNVTGTLVPECLIMHQALVNSENTTILTCQLICHMPLQNGSLGVLVFAVMG